MGFIITIHIITCILLIIAILIQAGRGGGLVEGFSNVESMFGPKTNTFLTRTTATLSILFFLTCLTLAFLSARQSRSLMDNVKVTETTKEEPAKTQEAPLPGTADVKKAATAEPAKEAQTTGAPKTE